MFLRLHPSILLTAGVMYKETERESHKSCLMYHVIYALRGGHIHTDTHAYQHREQSILHLKPTLTVLV